MMHLKEEGILILVVIFCRGGGWILIMVLKLKWLEFESCFVFLFLLNFLKSFANTFFYFLGVWRTLYSFMRWNFILFSSCKSDRSSYCCTIIKNISRGRSDFIFYFYRIFVLFFFWKLKVIRVILINFYSWLSFRHSI